MQIVSDVKLIFVGAKELPKPTMYALIEYRIHIERSVVELNRLKFNMSRFYSVCIFCVFVCLLASNNNNKNKKKEKKRNTNNNNNDDQ